MPTRRLPASVLLAWLALIGSIHAQSVQWQTDYSKARQLAKEKGLPLLLNVGTPDCFWCKQLDTRTFKDAGVVRLLNERFVPLKVDATKSPYLVNALRIESYPTIVYGSSDGKILGYQEGFLEADALKEKLLNLLTSVGTPDWMSRDYAEAVKSLTSDPAKALTLLRGVVDDGKDRAVQVKARGLIKDLEKKAADQLKDINALVQRGKSADAVAAIRKLARDYPNTPAVREGNQLLLRLRKDQTNKEDRARQARELLRQAREDYQNRQFLCCLDRCETLSVQYADFPEGAQGGKLAAEIKSNPDWTKKACEQLGDRLCVLWLALADARVKNGQPQEAVFYLEKITATFPQSKYAEHAKARLVRLRGAPSEEPKGGPKQ